MTGTMGITTVPLPVFWSSPKNEGDQAKRSPRKEHPCQNPRCAANNLACNTPHKEPPAKRIKCIFKNAQQDNLASVSANKSRTELENCGGIKAHGSYATKYVDYSFGNNRSPVSSEGTRAELETCGGIKAHGTFGGTFADCKVGSDMCPVSSNRTGTENSGGIKAQSSHGGKYAACKVANNLCSVSSKGTRTEADYCGGIKGHSGHAGKDTDCKVALAPGTMGKIRETFSGNSLQGSTGNISKESTTPMSLSSHAPSIPTPVRRPSKACKTGLAPLSVMEGSSSTSSSSLGRCSQGTCQSLPTCPVSESTDNTMDDQLTPSFLQSGRVAPPNSERDEEEVPPIEDLDRHKSPLTLPLFNRLPVRSSLTSRWPPTLPTEVDPIGRPVNLAPYNLCTPSELPFPPLTGVPEPMPPEATTKGIRSTQIMHSSSAPIVSKSGDGHSGFEFRSGTPEASTKGIRATPIHGSSSPLVPKASEGQTSSRNPQETPIIKHLRSRRTPGRPKSTESDRSIRSSTLTTLGNAAQMCILEQRLEDEDHQSNSSKLTTLGSDSPKESCSIDLSSTLCGSKPISAFYNALYAPDCTMSGTKALEAHLHRHRRGMDGTLRAPLEIAVLSVLITILVVVFYPAITRGLRSQSYGCCSCPAASAAAQGAQISQNPSQPYSQIRPNDLSYSQIRSNDGSCVYSGEGNLLKCSSARRTMGSTVVK